MVILILGLGPNAVAWVGSHYGSNFFIEGSSNSLYKMDVWAYALGFVLLTYVYVVLDLISYVFCLYK